MQASKLIIISAVALLDSATVAQVRDGFRVWANGGTQVTISPGTARIGQRNVNVSTTTVLEINLQDGLRIEKEPYQLSTKLADRWGPGTHLKGCVTANVLPGCLEPGSVRVTLPDGTDAILGQDYELNEEWATLARKPEGRLTTETEVLVSYTVGLMRIDAISITPAGKITITTGKPVNAAALVPDPTTGSLHLANVFLPYHSKSIELWQLFPVGSPFSKPSPRQLNERAAAIPGTLEKLRAGRPVTIVTWGDSVTVGGDASRPELAYANLFITRLREKYPGAQIRHANAGIGGTTTEGRLPAFREEVLMHRPDLVTIEFVNDMGFGEQKLRSNYDRAISQLRAIGAEVILITPHFVMPSWMGKTFPRGADTRPDVFTLRSIAVEHRIGLADAAARWAYLDIEGIPYTALLMNGINHPDDRGHAMFVDELMTFFP